MVKIVTYLLLSLLLLTSCLTVAETKERREQSEENVIIQKGDTADISLYRSRPIEPIVFEAVDSTGAAENPGQLVNFLLKM